MSQLLVAGAPGTWILFQRRQITPARVVVDLALEDLAQAAREKQVDITLVGCVQDCQALPRFSICDPQSFGELHSHVSERGRVDLKVIEAPSQSFRSATTDPASRSRNARARWSASTVYLERPSGSGLGLSIVGRVVELLAGDIELQTRHRHGSRGDGPLAVRRRAKPDQTAA